MTDASTSPTSDQAKQPPVELDQLGRLCPAPIIELGRWAKTSAVGAEAELLADDPAAAHDVAAWCRMRGAMLVEVHPIPGVPNGFRYRVRIGSSAVSAGSKSR
ncbi:MAG: sulfurtransferase TusA family protein [Candidatus Nanopelagicales bacterium]